MKRVIRQSSRAPICCAKTYGIAGEPARAWRPQGAVEKGFLATRDLQREMGDDGRADGTTGASVLRVLKDRIPL